MVYQPGRCSRNNNSTSQEGLLPKIYTHCTYQQGSRTGETFRSRESGSIPIRCTNTRRRQNSARTLRSGDFLRRGGATTGLKDICSTPESPDIGRTPSVGHPRRIRSWTRLHPDWLFRDVIVRPLDTRRKSLHKAHRYVFKVQVVDIRFPGWWTAMDDRNAI